MGSSVKTIVIVMVLLISASCGEGGKIERVNSGQGKLHETSLSLIKDNIIIYVLDSSVTQFIQDSIFAIDLEKPIVSCNFNICSTTVEVSFSYQDNDTLVIDEYLIKNTSRFLRIKNELIPVTFEEDIYFDYSFLDVEKSKKKTTNWMNYAVLIFNKRNEIIEYKNYYKQVLRAEGKIK